MKKKFVLMFFILLILSSCVYAFSFKNFLERDFIDGKVVGNIPQQNFINTKNINLFHYKNVFLISDEDWKDVLSLIPVTTWTESGEINKYPTLVYHKDNFVDITNYASLSNGATASASSTYGSSSPNNIIDEDIDTSWNNGASTEAWLLIDMSQLIEINQVKIFNNADNYKIKLSVSEDNINFQTIEDNYILDFGWNIFNFDVISITGVRYLKIELFDQPGQSSYPNWKQIAEVKAYNTNEGVPVETFDVDSIIHFMQLYKLYEFGTLTVVGDIPEELADLLVADFDPITKEGGGGLDEDQIEFITPNDYLNYWENYESIVWVQDDYKLSLLASVTSSYLNAPLVIGEQFIFNYPQMKGIEGVSKITGEATKFFIDSSPIFENKHVIVVGDMNCPSNAKSCEFFRNLEEIQHDYVDKTNTDKILITNPNDLNSAIIQEYPYLEKSSGIITHLYGKHSLIAPLLASGKHELIILDDHVESQNPPERYPDWETTDNLVEYYMENFFDNNAEYLTILAPPSMIAHSKEGNFGDIEVDLFYATKPNIIGGDFFLAPGRIYSITSSDVSSYIARSLFYNELINNIYNEDEYTAFTIGREAYSNHLTQINMYNVKSYFENDGYDPQQTICSTDYYDLFLINCEHIGGVLNSLEEQNFLRHKQFIQFSGHGGSSLWANALDPSIIPWLDLPVVGGVTACLTNNFYGVVGPFVYDGLFYKSFGANILRRGGVSYVGSIPPTLGTFLFMDDSFSKIFTSNILNLGLGRLNKAMIYTYPGGLSPYSQSYILLGDPTLIPKFKEFNYYECDDGIDNDGDSLIDYEDSDCLLFNSFEDGPHPQCNDLIDNDGDGYTDYPEDSGCISLEDNTENLCGDTITQSFTLTEDIICDGGYGISLSNDGEQELIFNCDGHLIKDEECCGTSGIYILNLNQNITIKNCIIENFNEGIHLPFFGGNIHLISNEIRNNYEGIKIDSVSNFELSGNNILDNEEIDIDCLDSTGFYSNEPNICENVENDGCNPEIICNSPGGGSKYQNLP